MSAPLLCDIQTLEDGASSPKPRPSVSHPHRLFCGRELGSGSSPWSSYAWLWSDRAEDQEECAP